MVYNRVTGQILSQNKYSTGVMIMSYKDYWGCPVCASENIQQRNHGFLCRDCYTQFRELHKFVRPLYGREETYYYIELIEQGREIEALAVRIERTNCSTESAKNYLNRIKIEYGLAQPCIPRRGVI